MAARVLKGGEKSVVSTRRAFMLRKVRVYVEIDQHDFRSSRRDLLFLVID